MAGLRIPGGISPAETIEGLSVGLKSYENLKTCQKINSIVGKSCVNFQKIISHDPDEYLSVLDFSETTRRYR